MLSERALVGVLKMYVWGNVAITAWSPNHDFRCSEW